MAQDASPAQRRHLDIGCGAAPRNPYRRPELFGLDIRRAAAPGSDFTFAEANLVTQPIPFADSHFGSVSAFDFIEHVPRIFPTADGQGTRFPFIELMNEVWRVLAPGGLFYALTPIYPRLAAFRDPTHVNFITDHTHDYFVSESPGARMYGFKGQFRARRCQWALFQDNQFADPLSLRQQLRAWQRTLRGRCSHFMWELEAVKA